LQSTFSNDELLEPQAPAAEPVDPWAQIFDQLRGRFPSASPGVLFCIHKLQQNPDLKLRDFKDEAQLHQVPLSGRSFHSARVLLGLEKAPAPRPRAATTEPDEDAAEPVAAPRARAAVNARTDETPAIAALRRYQEENAAETERLRAGVRRALAVIEAALAGE